VHKRQRTTIATAAHACKPHTLCSAVVPPPSVYHSLLCNTPCWQQRPAWTANPRMGISARIHTQHDTSGTCNSIVAYGPDTLHTYSPMHMSN
jgi:hypothetical protein